MVTPLTPTPGGSSSQSENFSQSLNQAMGQSSSESGSFIPNYSQTPILENIARYSESMAPQIYQWGMDVYGKNQGNIDELMRTAETYASGQRLAADVGMAESGVMQAGESALENSKRDLESYGIDPSSGRYAALDKAGRVQTAAAAAGAGNQQRQADIATSNAMKNQAISASLQNAQTGFQGANAANAFLGTAMRLPYSPLGTQSRSQSTNQSQGESQGYGYSTSASQGAAHPGGGGGGGARPGPQDSPAKQPPQQQGGGGGGGGSRPGGGGGGGGGTLGGGGGGGGGYGEPTYDPGMEGGGYDPWLEGGGGWDPVYPGDTGQSPWDAYNPGGSETPGIWGEGYPTDTGWSGDWGPTPDTSGGGDTSGWGGDYEYQEGGPVPDDDDEDDSARFVSPSLSPSNGAEVDDVPANLNAGEFVLPDDVVRWKGEEFFQSLISKSRDARSNIMQAHGQMQGGAI